MPNDQTATLRRYVATVGRNSKNISAFMRNKWCWTALAIFGGSLPMGFMVGQLEPHNGGDEAMAAALDAAYVAGGVLIIGFVFAMLGFLIEKERRVLRAITLGLYLVPITAALCCLLVYLANAH